MKRIFLFIGFLFLTQSAWATVYYVDINGGTKAQCTGLDPHILAGASGTACALKSPMYVMGAGCGNTGRSTCDVNPIWTTNDVMMINGDNGSGGQAQYPIGYDASGIITPASGSNCNTSNPYNCTMGNTPANTQIIGTGTLRPQLWGREKVIQVLTAANNNILLKNLEITDHSTCIYRGPSGPSFDGFPASCAESGAPLGPYGQDGLWLAGDSITLNTVWIHGMGHLGTNGSDLSNYTAVNTIISGNPSNNDGLAQSKGGINSSTQLSNGSNTGHFTNLTFDHYINIFAGCSERYPLVSSNIYNTSNYINCHDAATSAGQGDGVGSQADFTTCSGNIIFKDSDISYNMQDGIDLLHCGTGHFYFIRSRAEGNAGNQVKTNNQSAQFENSIVFANCNFATGQAWRNSSLASNQFEVCRGGADGILIVDYAGGGPYSIQNSTILSTSGSGILFKNDVGACGPTPSILNTSFIGGNSAFGGQTALYDTQSGCGGITPAMNYNAIYNSGNQGQCTGANSICGQNPQVTGSLTNVLGPNTLHTVGGSSLLYLGTGSPLRSAANSGLTFTNGATDYNSNSRTAWDIGAFKFGSLVPVGQFCLATGECNGQTCTNDFCGGTPGGSGGTSCVNNGSSCGTNGDCCTNFCTGGLCSAALLGNGSSCTAGTQCTSGNCCSNLCAPSACVSQTCGNCIVEGTEGCETPTVSGTCPNTVPVNGSGCSQLCQVEGNNFLPLTGVKSDPGGNLGVLTNSINYTNLDRNTNTSVTKDFGVNFFKTPLTHDLPVRIDSCHDNSPGGGNGALLIPWSLTKSVPASLQTILANHNGAFVYYYCLNGTNGGGPLFQWILGSTSTGVEVDATPISDSAAVGTTRYLDVVWSGSTLTLNVYADSTHTSLIGTSNVTDTQQYQFFATTMGNNTGASGTAISGNVGPITFTSASGGVFCGDGTCNGTDTCATCPADCGQCPNNPASTKMTITGQCTITGNFRVN